MSSGELCLQQQIVDLEKEIVVRDNEIVRLRNRLAFVTEQIQDQAFRDRLKEPPQ